MPQEEVVTSVLGKRENEPTKEDALEEMKRKIQRLEEELQQKD